MPEFLENYDAKKSFGALKFAMSNRTAGIATHNWKIISFG